MRHLKYFESYNQPDGTGKGSTWTVEVDGENMTVTLEDILDYLDDGKEIDPKEIEHLLIDVERDPERIDNADLDYPVILISRKGKIKSILDGQHRVVKAINKGEKIKVRILELDNAPDNFKSVFKDI